MGGPAAAPLPKSGDEPVTALVGSAAPQDDAERVGENVTLPAGEQFTEADKHEPDDEAQPDESVEDQEAPSEEPTDGND